MQQRGGDGLVIGLVAFLIFVLLGIGGFAYVQFQRARIVATQAQVELMQAERAKAMAEVQKVQKASATTETQQVTSKPSSDSSSNDVAAIKQVLNMQKEAWNDGDIDTFMESYWKSDDLTFSSGGKTTRSWQQTLDRYKERYPTREAMGTLDFSELEVQSLGPSAALVLGRWELQDLAGGNFTLVMKRLPEGWVIIHDHSSKEDSASEPHNDAVPSSDENL